MKFDKSFEYLARAEKVIPVQSQTFSKGWRYFPKGAAPIYLEGGLGSKVYDVDGNVYIDYILGLGPITLGYNYPAVDEAIMEQLSKGVIFSLPHPLEIELSELLVSIIPCAEMVRFSKNGTDVTNAAVKLARAYTGREKIAFCGYHGGGNDWYGITTEKNAGVIKVLKDYATPFEYNNLMSLENILGNNDIAGVILEPVVNNPPRDNFLQKLIELSHRYGAVVIFDEVVTGFRWSLGGAQKTFSAIPDLATFGKGIANGMPLNVLVGKREIMELLLDIFFSYTFAGECLSLAAGLATIQEMREKKTIEHCWKLGQRLMDGLNKIGLETAGYPCRPVIIHSFAPEEKSLFIQEYLKRGTLIHSSFMINLCYSHNEEDIDKTVQACDEAYDAVKETVSSGDWSILKGEIVKPAFKRL